MIKILKDLQVPLDVDLREHLLEIEPKLSDFRVLRSSVDARSRTGIPHFVYTIEIAFGEKLKNADYPLSKVNWNGKERPIVIGTGPAGLFCALRLIEQGVPCLLLERGSQAEKRIMGINRFWRYGTLDARNNVCFGEGGAGLYSDGKLITRIKSPHIPYVLHRLVKFGAPEEIQWLSNPHVGSDKIRRIIPILRKYLLENGCEIKFDTQVTRLLTEGNQITGVETEHGDHFKSPHVVLATGHSAEDIMLSAQDSGIFNEGKSFAMGLRIEHPQPLINQIQYKSYYQHPKLGSANYKLTHYDEPSDVGVYSFCMCPGGYVLSSGTDENRIVCNGMSNYNRNSPYANAAIVVSLDHDRLFKNDRMGGFNLRKNFEEKAFQAVQDVGGTKELPAQRLVDFLDGKLSTSLPKHSSPSGIKSARLDELIPEFMRSHMIQALQDFQRKMRGFIHPDALFFGVESRTSSPLRFTRNPETLESVSHAGLYPAGEGAGYAGGITSAACDGVRIADAIVGLKLS